MLPDFIEGWDRSVDQAALLAKASDEQLPDLYTAIKGATFARGGYTPVSGDVIPESYDYVEQRLGDLAEIGSMKWYGYYKGRSLVVEIEGGGGHGLDDPYKFSYRNERKTQELAELTRRINVPHYEQGNIRHFGFWLLRETYTDPTQVPLEIVRAVRSWRLATTALTIDQTRTPMERILEGDRLRGKIESLPHLAVIPQLYPNSRYPQMLARYRGEFPTT